MSIKLFGRWQLEVIEAIHNWQNRFVVAGAVTGNGVFPPDIGSTVDVDGAEWELRAEYLEPGAPDWQPSDMILNRLPERVDRVSIGSEDPLPQRDFEDIQWSGRYLGSTMLEIPYRPYAVRPTDLYQMPDGIFETALGSYYMGVRVVNRWGLPFMSTHTLDISPQSRAILASRGIQVIDSWSHAELATVGQQQIGTGMVLGPLNPGEARTVFFKVNVANAAPRKHTIEFVCHNKAGMLDPNHPMRRVSKSIFVSRTTIDSTTGDIVAEVRQGTLRMKLKEFAFDRAGAKRGRKRKPTGGSQQPDNRPTAQELRSLLTALLQGRPVDPCKIHRILACYCVCEGDGGGKDPGSGKPSDGRFEYDPFFIFPTKFSYAITPNEPFPGQYGPIPFDDPWWKVLLIIIAAILLLAGALEEASDLAYHDEDLVIGTLNRWQRNDVDAALCLLDTDRDLGFSQVLDAQSDEDNQNPITALDGLVNLNGPIMTKMEVETILMTTPADDPQRQVFKSGATTGLTHGLMTALAVTGHPEATWTIEQLRIVRDPAFGEDVSIPGDSGSVWVHRQSNRPVALNHSGSRDADGNPTGETATASLLEDVFSALNIQI